MIGLVDMVIHWVEISHNTMTNLSRPMVIANTGRTFLEDFPGLIHLMEEMVPGNLLNLNLKD